MVTKHTAAKKKPAAKRAARPGAPKGAANKTVPALWEQIVKIGERIPNEELDRHPADFVRNYHHYKHGHAKQPR